MLDRREFMQSMLHVSAGLVAGVRPQLPIQYHLTARINEAELNEAITVLPGGPERTFGGRPAIKVAVAIDEAKAWQAVKIFDQHGDLWEIEGKGEALVAPWGESFDLKGEQ